MFSGLQYIGEVVETKVKDDKYRSVVLESNGYKTSFSISTEEQAEHFDNLVWQEVTVPLGTKLLNRKDWGKWTQTYVRKEFYESK